MSFDGTRADQTVLTPATPEIWFADKCESENFLMLDGQEVHLTGNYLGTLEVLVPNALCTSGDADELNAIIFHKSDGTTSQWNYSELCFAFYSVQERGSTRFFVTAKQDTI